jgi:5-methylcytosine-specific restriction endonuclease McrA
MDLISRADALASGLKRYSTGRPCKYGHVAERTVCDHACVECGRLHARKPEVRERLREYMAAHQRRYRKEHPDRVRATKMKHGHAHLAAYKRALRAKNPEPSRVALRRSFQKHRTKRMEESRAWKAANPEANSRLQRSAKARRRALELGAEGSYTRQDIERMHMEQKFICAACPTDISVSYHVDHMIPLARSGTNFPSNLQLLCGTCNRSKGKKTMAEWIAWKAQFTPPLLESA